MKACALALAAAIGVAHPAAGLAQYADQDEPRHGGVTNWNTNSEYSFELVARQDGVTLYIEDHETPVSTKGAKGTLVIRRAGASNRAPLVPAGDNRMIARGASATRGDHVAATVTLASGAIMMGRFVIP